MQEYIDTEKLRTRYPKYVTRKQMMEMMRISGRTAYLLLKNGIVHYERCTEGMQHYYKIDRDEIILLIRQRQNKIADAGQKEQIRDCLEKKFRNCEDLLLTSEVSRLCGLSVKHIQRLIQDDCIHAVSIRRTYYIPKAELIRYMTSESYLNSPCRTKKKQKIIREINAGIAQERRKERII